MRKYINFFQNEILTLHFNYFLKCLKGYTYINTGKHFELILLTRWKCSHFLQENLNLQWFGNFNSFSKILRVLCVFFHFLVRQSLNTAFIKIWALILGMHLVGRQGRILPRAMEGITPIKRYSQCNWEISVNLALRRYYCNQSYPLQSIKQEWDRNEERKNVWDTFLAAYEEIRQMPVTLLGNTNM